MRKLFCLLILVSFGAITLQAKPSPKSNQLRIGFIGSGDSNIDSPAQGKGGAWRWVADHYGYYAGSNLNREEIDSLKRFNPNMKITKYDIHARMANDVPGYVSSDSMNVIRYCQAIGVPLESLMVVATGTVTINNRACPGYTYCGNITTNAGGIVKYINYSVTEPRMMFDPRSPKYGYYLAHKYDSICTALNIDGIFGDEYGAVGYTGIPNCDECTMSTMWPLREPNYWTAGWDLFKKPFGVSFANFYNGRDSLRKWDTTKWFPAMIDSLVNIKGRMYLMNTSANGGSIPGYWVQWTNDIAPMVRLAKQTAQGEYTYQYPGDGSYYDNCRVFLRQMLDVRDYARYMGWMWIRLGQYDQSQQGHSLDRSQMTALGFILGIEVLNKSATNPYGKVDNLYLPCRQNGQTDFYYSSPVTLNGVTIVDTTCLWNDAWGKFWGDPSGSLDTSGALLTAGTSDTTDATGQKLKLDVARFYKPGTTNVLTMAIGRIGRGTISYDTNTTGKNVTLPAGTWYPLRSTNHVVRWGSPMAGGSVIKIGNSHFQIFSTDTLMSNDSSAAAPSDPTGACCIVTSCSITTQAACVASGGTYQGDNTVCSPNPCNAVITPTGACCLNNVCTITTQANCAGYWQGANTTCNPSYLCGFPSTADTTKKQVINGQIIINGQVILK